MSLFDTLGSPSGAVGGALRLLAESQKRPAFWPLSPYCWRASGPLAPRSRNRPTPVPAAKSAPPLAAAPGPSAASGTLPPLRLPPGQEPAAPDAPKTNILHLSAVLSATDAQPLRGGLRWRIFDEKAELDGSHALVAESFDATPALTLRDGSFIVHAAFGLAGATKRVTIDAKGGSERLVLNAGALRVVGMLGDAPIPPAKTQISIYVPGAQ